MANATTNIHEQEIQKVLEGLGEWDPKKSFQDNFKSAIVNFATSNKMGAVDTITPDLIQRIGTKLEEMSQPQWGKDPVQVLEKVHNNTAHYLEKDAVTSQIGQEKLPYAQGYANLLKNRTSITEHMKAYVEETQNAKLEAKDVKPSAAAVAAGNKPDSPDQQGMMMSMMVGLMNYTHTNMNAGGMTGMMAGALNFMIGILDPIVKAFTGRSLTQMYNEVSAAKFEKKPEVAAEAVAEVAKPTPESKNVARLRTGLNKIDGWDDKISVEDNLKNFAKQNGFEISETLTHDDVKKVSEHLDKDAQKIGSLHAYMTGSLGENNPFADGAKNIVKKEFGEQGLAHPQEMIDFLKNKNQFVTALNGYVDEKTPQVAVTQENVLNKVVDSVMKGDIKAAAEAGLEGLKTTTSADVVRASANFINGMAKYATNPALASVATKSTADFNPASYPGYDQNPEIRTALVNKIDPLAPTMDDMGAKFAGNQFKR